MLKRFRRNRRKPKPLQINRIDLSDIKVYTILKGREDTRVIPLIAPPVHLQDLGTEPEGIIACGGDEQSHDFPSPERR